MPITNLPPLRRYLDDKQWAVVGRAIKQAGGKTNDGNRLHVDSILDLMRTRMPWRDLDPRYGPWASVHFKYVRWLETGILHGITQALFDLGLTEEWRPVFTEISHGLSARSGPAIRPLMTQIVVELRRHRDIKAKGGKKAAPKFPKAETTIYRDKKKQYANKVKEAVAARKGENKKVLTSADWALIVSRIPEFDAGPQDKARRQIDELLEVMRTNKGWSYMDPKAGKPSAVYSRFAKWTAEGLMTRLVKCLVELGLTKDWNQFLVATLPKGEASLKLVIGADAHRFMFKPAKKKAGSKRVAAKAKAKAHVAAKERVLKGKAKKTKVATAKAKEATKEKTAKTAKMAKTPARAPAKAAVSGKAAKPAKSSKTAKTEVAVKPKAAKKVAATASKASPVAKLRAEAVKAKSPTKVPAAKTKQPAAPAKTEAKATRSTTAKRTRSTARPSGKTKVPSAVVAASRAAKGSKAQAARR
jgi:transposase